MPRNKLETKCPLRFSSSALFDLSASDEIFREQGVEAYANYQVERESDVLEPGVAFHLVKKLLRLNQILNADNAVK